jgi:hypothetical protein
MHGGLSGLAKVGNLLDIPSSMLRDVISSVATQSIVNPFDQLLSPFSPQNRTTGRELLAQFGITQPNVESGMAGWLDDPMEAVRDIAGFAVEVGLDVPGYGLFKQGLRAAAPTAKSLGAAAAATRPGAATVDFLKPSIDYGIAAFSKPVMGGLGKIGRALGRSVHSGLEDAGVLAREVSTPIVEEWGRFTSKMDKGQYFDSVDNLFDALETGMPLQGDMARLQPHVDKMRETYNGILAVEKAEGVKTADLQSLHDTLYAKRGRHFFEDKPGRGRSARLISGRHESQIAREDFLKDLEGLHGGDNTSMLNGLSRNPLFSGVAHGKAPAELGRPFWRKQSEDLQAWMAERGINEEYGQYDKLARWLGDLSPEHVKQQIPVFARDPIEMFEKRLELSFEAIAMAKTMRATMAKNVLSVEDAPAGYQSAKDSFTAAGFDVRQSMALLRKEAGLEAIEEAAEEGVEKIVDLRIPPELAENIGRVATVFHKRDEVAESIFGMVDGYTRVWKAGVTSWPAFHARNRISGMFMNFVDGFLTARSEKATMRLMDGKKIENIPWGKLGKEYRGLSNLEATKKFAQETRIYKVAPGGQGHALEGLPRELQRKLADEIPGFEPLSAGRAAKEGLIPLKPMFTGRSPAAEWTEGMNRISPYLERRLQGMSPKEAAAQVRASQVDYTDLSNFERNYVNPWIPFYKFTKGMTKKVASELIEHPGFALKDGKWTGRMSVAIRAQGGGQREDQPLPDYLTQTAAIPLGKLAGGGQRFLTSLGLMHEDTLSFLGDSVLDTGTEILSRTHPIPKAILELITGESFFQRGPMGGRELREMDPPLGRLLTNLGLREEAPGGRARPVGEKYFGGKLESLLSNINPFLRGVFTARTSTDPRKALFANVAEPPTGILSRIPGPAVGFNVLTGVKVSDLSPAARDRAMRERLDQITLDELGGRGLTQTWIPPEEIERMRLIDPAQAQKMEQRNMLMKLIGKRFRDRKKEKLLKEQMQQAVQTAP